MYRKEDLERVNAQIRRERLQFYVPAALLIAGGVVAFILRMKYLTMILLALGGVLFIFSADVMIAPLKAYRRHLQNALGGDQKEYTGVIKKLGDRPVEREGVMYYPFCLSVGDPENEEDDRLLYLDANLKKPDWHLGDRLYVRSWARFVSAWEKR